MNESQPKPADVPEDDLFSAFVAQLGRGEEPTPQDYDAVLEELRGVLVQRMHRRGLWYVPPVYLGCAGQRWSDGGLDELVNDAYTFNFIDRLPGLIDQQQRQKPNIRPMVVRNVDNYLTDRQKKADPLGHRLFGRLRSAVEEGIRGGRLRILNDGERLKNGSVLAFGLGDGDDAPEMATRAALGERVRRWNDTLLPDLVTAEGPAVPKVVERLAGHVCTLADDGIRGFRFGELLDELKNDVRSFWQAAWDASFENVATEYEDDGTAFPVPFVDADDEPDWPQRLLLIQECVETSIDNERKPKGKRELRTLWLWIRTQRIEAERYGALPAFAELGRQLKMTRERVRQLYERLRPMVENCLRTAGRTASFPERSEP